MANRKSSVERTLIKFKKAIDIAAKTNPAVKSVKGILRDLLYNDEEKIHVAKGLGKILAERYFPLAHNPAKSFYAHGVDPRSIKQIKSS